MENEEKVEKSEAPLTRTQRVVSAIKGAGSVDAVHKIIELYRLTRPQGGVMLQMQRMEPEVPDEIVVAGIERIAELSRGVR